MALLSRLVAIRRSGTLFSGSASKNPLRINPLGDLLMPDRIKVGVLTHAGGAHLSAYFEALAKTDEVEGVTLADPDGKSEEMARKMLGSKLTQVYKEHGELLRQEKPPMALVSMEAALGPPVI